jgi:hypothetical protein
VDLGKHLGMFTEKHEHKQHQHRRPLRCDRHGAVAVAFSLEVRPDTRTLHGHARASAAGTAYLPLKRPGATDPSLVAGNSWAIEAAPGGLLRSGLARRSIERRRRVAASGVVCGSFAAAAISLPDQPSPPGSR